MHTANSNCLVHVLPVHFHFVMKNLGGALNCRCLLVSTICGHIYLVEVAHVHIAIAGRGSPLSTTRTDWCVVLVDLMCSRQCCGTSLEIDNIVTKYIQVGSLEWD